MDPTSLAEALQHARYTMPPAGRKSWEGERAKQGKEEERVSCTAHCPLQTHLLPTISTSYASLQQQPVLSQKSTVLCEFEYQTQAHSHRRLNGSDSPHQALTLPLVQVLFILPFRQLLTKPTHSLSVTSDKKTFRDPLSVVSVFTVTKFI